MHELERLYHIHCAKGEVGRYVLLPGDPGRCPSIAALFDDAHLVARNREYTTYTGTLLGEKVSVCSTGTGGPSAGIALEELHAIGADTFVRTGTCGGIKLEVQSGDLVIATGAVRHEGASREYAPIEFPAVPDYEVLSALVDTAGGQAVGMILQSRDKPDPHSFIGEGKAQEVRMLAEATQSTMVIFDNELSPGNIRALEEIIGLPVLDRSALILDIFAQRAKTKEGRLQVELAQYKYLLPRLSGMGTSLSRQGGGIGTRGPGETKLESDRRHIRERINRLEEELEQVRKVRSVQRERRMKNSVPVVAIVGYTNAGKSTLLNQLTGAGIPANNRLFDTLVTTTRLLTFSVNLDVLLSDTVGFIAKLPHHLVDAFRATLEELEFADLLLHVIDASDPHLEEHIAVVDRLISQLAKPETPVLKCYNKADLVYSDDIPVGKNIVAISAKRGINMDGLLKAIESALNHARHHIVVRLPYAMGGMVETLHDGAQVKKVDYTPEGIEIEAVVDGILYGRLREYINGE